MDIKKLLIIFTFLIILVISPSFAYEDNATDSPISANYGDVYFNSSTLNDGDGSIDNPYNKITMDRINNYATLHLADGEYDVAGFKTISSLTIMGESSENTIIRHDGLLFTVLSDLSLNNLTLSGVTIKNQGIVNSTNVIFSDATGRSSDSYNNIFGGVFDNQGTNYITPKLYLDNCIFKNNHAEYGGAIYLINAEAVINNCLFDKNIAYNYGGAIACDGSSKLTIKKTIFKFDSSSNDAGGALYLKDSSIIIENSNFTNCDSLFGGAICDLKSVLSIDNALFSSNNAVYDGGAIFKMYGELSVLNSKFNFNTANNGGAIFADNSSSFSVQSSRFSSNSAKYCGGAIYSLLNKNSVINSNIYTRNKANSYPNLFETDLVNLFIGNNNYSMFKYNPSVNELPSKYSSVDEGYVTPVKDQQASGNCWAFTAIAALESCILKASNITYDLSEENLKNIMELYSDYGWNMVTNGGGYDNMAIGYFASWLGPVLEENDSFDDHSTLSPVLDSIMHIQNIIFLGRDNFTDNNKIKEAIIKYGAVGTGFYYSGSYLFGNSYYYSGSASENHAVTIVGWDDDYPYYNFRNPAPANGAWIVKNSWDDDWADKGYFYVSYYDSRFARVGNAISSYTFVLNDTLRYDKNYQYDIIGLTKFISSENEIWYENIFNSTDDEVLTAFSTYFAEKSNWTSYVYVNDELLLIQNGTSLPGYYTFDFNDFIYLNKGDSFKIVLKLENDGFARVPVSERSYSNKIFYKEGISFFSYDGEEWYDFYNYAGSQVACLKAFTIIPSILLEINDIDEYYVNDLFNITSIISDNSLNGSVIYNIGGNLFTVNVTDGFATLPISFNKSGIYDCSAYFVGEGKFSNKVDFTINIKNIILNTTILMDNVTSVVNEVIVLNASVFDENGDLVTNGNVTWVIGNVTFICPVVNGSAVWEVSFDKAGNYSVVVSFDGVDYYPSSKEINLNVLMPIPASVFAEDMELVAGDKGTVKYTTTPEDLPVTFESSDVSVVTVDADGNVIAVGGGNATITVTVGDGKVYAINSTVISVTVNKIDTILTVEDVITVYNNNRFVVATLTDVNGNVLSGVNVKIVVGNLAEIAVTDAKGQVSLDITALEPGEYAIRARSSGVNGIYSESKAFAHATVYPEKLDTTLTVPDVYVIGNSSGVVVATLKDSEGKSIGDIKVKILVGGLTKTALTDANGQVSFDISDLGPGMYRISARSSGVHDLYKEAKATAKAIVSEDKLDAILTVPDVYVIGDSSGVVVATLKDSYGNLVSGVNVKIVVNKLSVTAKTDENGQVSLDVSGLAPGQYKVSARSSGVSDIYKEAKATAKAIVSEDKLDATLTVPDVYVIGDSSGVVVASLKDSYGNIISGINVKIVVGNLTVVGLTDENGQVSLDVSSLAPGQYKVSARSSGVSDIYKEAKASARAIVSEDKLDTTLTVPDVVVGGSSSGVVVATLKDCYNNCVSGVNVKIAVGGLTKTAKTDKNGQVSLDVGGLAPGQYKVSARSSGVSDIYKEAKATAKVTVN